MRHMDLIFSSGGTPGFADIALRHGWRSGAQLPCTVYTNPLYFADNKYRDFNESAYVDAIQEHRPEVATLLDIEDIKQIDRVLNLGWKIAPYVAKRLIIIPKVKGIIKDLPYEIGGLRVDLGYSIFTSNGGTNVLPEEFNGRTVHLLGGSPQKQMALAQGWKPRGKRRALFDMPECDLNVVSVDTNYHQKMANKFCAFWVNGTGEDKKNRYFTRLSKVGIHTGQDDIYTAFEKSSVNIIQAWRAQGFIVNQQLPAQAGSLAR